MATFDDDLIETVKKFPILYRSKGKKLQNMLYKESCWKEVAFALNRTPEECKTKWRNIRDGYKKNKKKKNTGGPCTISKYDDDRLKFLDSAEEDNVEIISNNMDGVKEEYDPFEEVPLAEQQYSLHGTNDMYTVPPTCTPVITATSSELNLNTDQNVSQEEEPNQRKGAKRKYNRSLQHSGENAYSAEISPTHKFFSSMADIVSKFPPDKIAEMRMKICNMVSEMELSLLTNKTQTATVQANYYEVASSP